MFFKKKKKEIEDKEYEDKDNPIKDYIQIIISRLENNTKVTVKQFNAKYFEDTETNVAYWVNDKYKFKQPVSDYVTSNIKSEVKKDKDEIQKELQKLKKKYEFEISKDPSDNKLNKDLNTQDLLSRIEELEHQEFIMKHSSNNYSIVGRNLQGMRKVEYVQIGSKLYPLGFNPKLMSYFIIPVDKDIALDKHRENVQLKYMLKGQQIVTALVIIMLLITVAGILIMAVWSYKLFFAYDQTSISTLQRDALSNSIIQGEIFEDKAREFEELVEEIKKANQDLIEEEEKIKKIDNLN